MTADDLAALAARWQGVELPMVQVTVQRQRSALEQLQQLHLPPLPPEQVPFVPAAAFQALITDFNALLAEALRLGPAVAAMLDHLPGCHHITGFYALENDCSCGLYERQQVLEPLLDPPEEVAT